MKSKNKSVEYQIRYNTASKDDRERWRLIQNEEEILVSNVIVDGHSYTTKDWIPEINDYKWHVSCNGYCEIKNNIAYIKTVKDDNVLFRHILKTVSYRFVGTLTTFFTAYLLGASLELSSLLGVVELLIKPVLYFFHERAWYNFGKIKK